jgi:iron complex outermembrane receptor protein
MSLLVCAAGALQVPMLASAQTTAAAGSEPAAAGGARLETVVVSATRRDETSQDVPISIAAFSEAQLTELGVDNVSALTQLVPGFLANRVGPFPVYFIRGVGTSGSAPTVEPAVATYIDDVYIPASALGAISSYNNVSRVEVLKGPQGTLFGRNSTAGVVQIFTRDPDQEAALETQLGYGNYSTYSGALYANVPISETWAANISVDGKHQDEGWGRNTVTGNDVGWGWDWSARAKVMGELADNVTARLSMNAGRTRTDFGGFQRVARGTRTVYGFSSPDNLFDVSLDKESYYTGENWGASLKLEAQLAHATLVSISAYQDMKAENRTDLDFGPTNVNYLPQWPEQQTFSQEFQLLSPAQSRVQWILGLFYFDDNGGNLPRTQTGTAVPAGLYSLSSWSKQSTESWSGFGEVVVPIVTDLRVTAGLRYTSDQRDYERHYFLATSPSDPVNPVSAPGSPTGTTWSKTTGRFGVDYSITDELMVYAMYSTGFRSGTYQMNPGFSGAVESPVDPENVAAITAGVKSEFLDGRLRVNVEGFRNTYKDLQLQQTGATGTFTVNAGKAVYKGVDIDVAAQLTDNFSVTAAASILDGKYESYPNGTFNVYRPTGGNCTFTIVPGGPAPCGGLALPPNYDAATGTWDLEGNDAIQSPPLSYTLSARYERAVSVGTIDANVALFYSDEYFFDADNGLGQVGPSSQANDRQDELYLLRAGLGWSSVSNAWSVRLWGENLTNKTYLAHASENALGVRNIPAAPRTYGVTVGWRF